MNIGERIKDIRKKKGMTQAQLAAASDVATISIHQYEAGKRQPRFSQVEKIAAALGVSAAYLLGWENQVGETDVNLAVLEIAEEIGVRAENVEAVMEGIPTPDTLGDETIDRIRTRLQIAGLFPAEAVLPAGFVPVPQMRPVPVVGHIACGAPITAEQNIEGYVDAPVEVRVDFVLICHGDSMIDAGIQDGDAVYIRKQPKVENGQIAAVRIGGEATLKRVYFDGETMILQPANARYAPISFRGEEVEDIAIEGLAVGFTHWF